MLAAILVSSAATALCTAVGRPPLAPSNSFSNPAAKIVSRTGRGYICVSSSRGTIHPHQDLSCNRSKHIHTQARRQRREERGGGGEGFIGVLFRRASPFHVKRTPREPARGSPFGSGQGRRNYPAKPRRTEHKTCCVVLKVGLSRRSACGAKPC